MKVLVILCVVAAAMAHPQGQVVDPAFYQPGNGAGPQIIDPGFYHGGGAGSTNGVHVVDNNAPPSKVHVVDNPNGVNVVNNGPYPPAGGDILIIDPFYNQWDQPPSDFSNFDPSFYQYWQPPIVIGEVDPLFSQPTRWYPPSVINNVDPFYYQGGQPPKCLFCNADIGPTFVNQGTWNRPDKPARINPWVRDGK